MHDPYKVQHNFKTPVRLQDNPKAIQPINRHAFVGVSPRKKMARFYLSGISNKSTRSGIVASPISTQH